MHVSVVIPAYNEAKLIQTTLARVRDACLALHRCGWSTEIVVCDNNSNDDTARLARQSGAQVVFQPVNQIGLARNTGAKAATGDWLVFIDADSHPSQELFWDMSEAIADRRWIAGGSTVVMDQPIHWFWRFWVCQWNLTSRITRWAAGSFLFCEAQAFHAVGGFPQDLFVGEEIELSRRLKRYGRRHGRGLVILTRHPLLTSSRKLRLYSRKEMAGLMFNSVFRPNHFMRNRQACYFWYDGRR